MPVTRAQATPEQISNFIIANGSAVDALHHAILVYEVLPAHVPFEQRARVDLAKATAIAERAVLLAEHVEFMSRQGQVEPPDAPTVAAVEAIAAEIDRMTANASALVGLVQGVTRLVNAYRGAAAVGAGGGTDVAAAAAADPSARFGRKEAAAAAKSLARLTLRGAGGDHPVGQAELITAITSAVVAGVLQAMSAQPASRGATAAAARTGKSAQGGKKPRRKR